MEDWQYRFPQVTKEEWLTRVTTDLKGKSVSSLESEWWPGEIRHPLHHKEDLDAAPPYLPDHLFKNAPALTECIDARNRTPEEINSEILLSLQNGVQSIILRIGNAQVPFPKILDGVIEDFISISVEPEYASDLNETAIPPNLIVRLKNGGIINENANTRFVYDIPSEGSWIKEITEIFRNILQHFTEHGSSSSFLEHCVFRYSADKDFLKQIIQTRVIHIVWQNILNVNGVNSDQNSVYLECHIQPNGQTDPDKYLIQASSCALAASMTGVHALCVHPIEGDVPRFYHRINRNIAHLLQLESEMYKDADPLAGSYAIDFYTRKWSSEILTSLNL